MASAVYLLVDDAITTPDKGEPYAKMSVRALDNGYQVVRFTDLSQNLYTSSVTFTLTPPAGINATSVTGYASDFGVYGAVGEPVTFHDRDASFTVNRGDYFVINATATGKPMKVGGQFTSVRLAHRRSDRTRCAAFASDGMMSKVPFARLWTDIQVEAFCRQCDPRTHPKRWDSPFEEPFDSMATEGPLRAWSDTDCQREWSGIRCLRHARRIDSIGSSN
ncbi:MAG: hypothetical protein Ct9H90mP16_01540 [Candidatus Poseidoniales archaeon]|nr:MAG: hypothetical protein Ct9H90mP16_01540 [Candidatus Poseidoniales archaeon]